MNKNIEGKVVVITGATSGLGTLNTVRAIDTPNSTCQKS